jgi:hypothetical protein
MFFDAVQYPAHTLPPHVFAARYSTTYTVDPYSAEKPQYPEVSMSCCRSDWQRGCVPLKGTDEHPLPGPLFGGSCLAFTYETNLWCASDRRPPAVRKLPTRSAPTAPCLKTYSKDLRLKVLAAVDRGMPRGRVAEVFGVCMMPTSEALSQAPKGDRGGVRIIYPLPKSSP